MKYSELEKRTKEAITTLEAYVLSIKTGLLSVSYADTEEKARKQLLEVLEESSPKIMELIKSLRKPIYILEVESHPCEGCIVLENNLDADEHCDGCINEHVRCNVGLDEEAGSTGTIP